MEKIQIREKVQEIFRDIFDNRELAINDITNSSDIEEWDSLNNVNLIVSMEKEFKVKFALSELINLNNVGEMIYLIERKIK